MPWMKLLQTIGACAVEGEGPGGLVVALIVSCGGGGRGGERRTFRDGLMQRVLGEALGARIF